MIGRIYFFGRVQDDWLPGEARSKGLISTTGPLVALFPTIGLARLAKVRGGVDIQPQDRPATVSLTMALPLEASSMWNVSSYDWSC